MFQSGADSIKWPQISYEWIGHIFLSVLMASIKAWMTYRAVILNHSFIHKQCSAFHLRVVLCEILYSML